MGRLPQTVESPEACGPEELVVSLHVHEELKSGSNGGQRSMNRNVLYVVIGVLVVATVVFGYQLYQERQKTTGVEISIGDRGISIEKK